MRNPLRPRGRTRRANSNGFHDTFDTLDQSRWFLADGWTNGAHQSCTWRANRVTVNDGVLELSLGKAEDGTLVCAEIQSKQRHGYGTYEVRMKVPYATGMNASLFTFIGAPQDRPHNEIDFEFISPDTPVLQTNIHVDGESGNEMLHPMPDDGQFRTYSFTWLPGSIRWYIDGKLIREETGDVVPDEEQKIYMALWSTESLVEWMGRFDPASAPQMMEVDWVAFTPQGAGCQFDGSVLCDAAAAGKP